MHFQFQDTYNKIVRLANIFVKAGAYSSLPLPDEPGYLVLDESEIPRCISSGTDASRIEHNLMDELVV